MHVTINELITTIYRTPSLSECYLKTAVQTGTRASIHCIFPVLKAN